MSTWLDPIRRALDAGSSPAAFFLRDDDAGWEDEKLYRLLDLVTYFHVAIDVAAIPMAISSSLAVELRAFLKAGAPLVSVHQHGFAHANHEPSGRSSEFGAFRPRDLQRQDLTEGRERLQQALGRALPPIFTPPWNRCSRDTAECLAELGFQILSRDVSAEPFGLAPLHELPVRLDWSGRRGAGIGAVLWGEAIARTIASRQPIGIMLHHAVMTADDRRMLCDLLDLLAGHANAVVRPMFDFAAASQIPRGKRSCAS
jgi:predicted deacetylase